MDIIRRARQDYADGVTTLIICERYRIGKALLYRWLTGGAAVGDATLEPIARRRPGAATVRRRRLTGDRVALVRRMWRAAEAQVRDIEDRLQGHRQQPDDRERDARMLAVLVKTLRELSSLDDNARAGAPTMTAPPDQDDDIPRDIEEFRRELARRIHAFVGEGTGGRIPGDAISDG
jgi:hypothetical protein